MTEDEAVAAIRQLHDDATATPHLAIVHELRLRKILHRLARTTA